LRRVGEIGRERDAGSGPSCWGAEAFFSLGSDFCLSGRGERALGMRGSSVTRGGRGAGKMPALPSAASIRDGQKNAAWSRTRSRLDAVRDSGQTDATAIIVPALQGLPSRSMDSLPVLLVATAVHYSWHLARIRVMSSCCSCEPKWRTSSTMEASAACDESERWRRRASRRRRSPNSSLSGLKDSVMPSV
jgi:hypothetical protein